MCVTTILDMLGGDCMILVPGSGYLPHVNGSIIIETARAG